MRTGLLFLLLTAVCSTALSQNDPRIISVTPSKAGLNSTIEVVVEHLDSLSKPDSGKPPAIVPFLNGVELKGSKLDYIDRTTGTLRFTLRRGKDSDSHQAWNNVLSGVGALVRTYPISVGIEGGAPIPSKASSQPVTLQLVVLPPLRTAIAFIIFCLLLIIFLVLAAKTTLLKDPPLPGQTSPTYSLGRCQMAWWTFIIMASFLFIWLVTGDTDFPSSSLILIGISSATALSAVIINPNPKKAVPAQNNATKLASFFSDLLNDEDGTAFHRFQLFAWTIVLGMVFITKVIYELAQPDLDPTLLMLMGISAGTYIGFKFQEK